ncbi:MAG: hypothetical protein K8L97_25315 [Anaerolineae bacterium]|nr:hypothetical protein [Anaerolineae bacterium]
MKFTLYDDHIPLNGKLIYNMQEYSFDFIAKDEHLAQGGMTLSIGTLQIEVNIEDRFLLFPWGLHAYTAWVKGSLPQVIAKRAGVKVTFGDSVKAGVAVKVDTDKTWKTLFDPHIGWICVHSDNKFDQYQNVEFAEGSIISLHESQIKALWLQPSNHASINF